MSNQIVFVQLESIIDGLCTDMPKTLREIADAIEAGRFKVRYHNHRATGLGPSDAFGLYIVLYLYGNMTRAENAPAMLGGSE